MFQRHALFAAILVGGLVFGPACIISDGEGGGPMHEKVESVALEGIETAEIALDIAAGKLIVRGADSADLLAGTFRYNRTRLEPSLDYSRFGDRGRVVVRHRRRGSTMFGSIRNTWNLVLSTRVPLDLDLDCGAGESDLDLRGFDMRSLTIDMGVGALRADLTGERARSLDVTIDGGIGEAELELPKDIGVRVEVDGGIGSVDAPGFSKAGHVYTNEAWGRTAITITVSIDAGIGSVNLKLR